MATTLTTAQLEELEVKAAAAVRDGLARHGDTSAIGQPVTAALVTAAVRAGISHRAIAIRAGVDGLTIARAIDDETEQNRALTIERHHAERYFAQVKDMMWDRAQYLLGIGRDKQDVAEWLGISRVTLNEWLRKALGK